MTPKLGNFYIFDTPLHGLQTVEITAVHRDTFPTSYTIQWTDPDGHPMTMKTDELLRFKAIAPAPLPAAMSRTEDLEQENARLKTEIDTLKARQMTPDMLAVWEEYQTMKETQSARYVINNQSYLRSNLWHAFMDAMKEDE